MRRNYRQQQKQVTDYQRKCSLITAYGIYSEKNIRILFREPQKITNRNANEIGHIKLYFDEDKVQVGDNGVFEKDATEIVDSNRESS